MQKWEYIVLHVESLNVISHNGKHLGRLVKTGGIFASEHYEGQPVLYEYLNVLGKEGWELVSSAPSWASALSTTADSSHYNLSYNIYLKRLIQE